MSKVFIVSGALAGLLAVLLGAFAAHGLREYLDIALLSTFKTGVQYQMYHALALVLIGVLAHQYPGQRLLRWSGILFVTGILLFSGSLYMLALTQISWFGPITPVGGLAFMAGWLALAYAATKF
ncbi:MAG: DUF423 domain-containing protein [Pseudomonadales bacterium]